MPKKKKPSTVEKPKASVHHTPFNLIMNVVREKNIVFDYEVITEKVIPYDGGFILNPKNPLIKLTPRHGSTTTK